MRERMARELRPHGPWDVKLRAGGMIDVEFIGQVLQLVHVGDAGFRRSQTTRVALQRLGAVGVISLADAAVLIEADRLWRTIQGMLRMTVGQVETAALPRATEVSLLHAVAAAGVAETEADALLQALDAIAMRVRGLFGHYVGEVEG
jgi:glutamate-ammonia-ligase adenylyltransferase